MLDEIIVLMTIISLAVLFFWAFRTLAGERWQFFASRPVRKNADGTWQGVNYTYYGFFSATGYSLATIFFIIMMSSLNISPLPVMAFICLVFLVCMPASSWIARIVEKKQHTLTIGGASFLGIILSPWIVSFIDYAAVFYDSRFAMPVWPALAALGSVYCLGESIGRLACISFGCCYGRPVSDISGRFAFILEKAAFVFHGKTKKIAYASGLDGQKVIPVQAFSAVILAFAFLAGFYLFLNGHYTASLFVSVGISQIWRAFSETLRADYRGYGKISAYQKMAVASILYILILYFADLWEIPEKIPDPATGLAVVRDAGILFFVQAVWLVSFIYTGKSSVTSVVLEYSVVQENI